MLLYTGPPVGTHAALCGGYGNICMNAAYDEYTCVALLGWCGGPLASHLGDLGGIRAVCLRLGWSCWCVMRGGGGWGIVVVVGDAGVLVLSCHH